MDRQKGRVKSWIGKRGTVEGGIDKRDIVKGGGRVKGRKRGMG